MVALGLPLTAGFTRRAAPRLQALNVEIRAAAERYGVRLVEMEPIRDASDLRLWSADRIHLNPEGHRRLGAAFDAVFRGSGEEEWMEPLPAVREPGALRRTASEALWVARFVVPKVVRMVRGKSSGDGRGAKRGELRRVAET